MEIEFIQNLEKYCLGLQSNNSNERETSEQSILSLMKTPQPYKLCFNLLSKSNLTIAHFYGLLMIRDSAIREWAALDSQSKIMIIETLFQYIENMNSMKFLNYATKGQTFNTLGVIIKRGWLDNEKYDIGKGQMELNQLVMDRVYQYIDSGLPDRIEISIKIIGSLIIEFSSSSKAAHIQLSWEFHQKCLITFQNLHLQPIFRKVLELLQQFKEAIQQVPSRLTDQSFLQILYTSVKVFTDILDWRFLESGSSVLAYITSFSGGRTNLKPTIEWISLFSPTSAGGISPVVSLVFGLYDLVEKVEKIPNLLRHTMSQLCGLQGPIIKDQKIKNQYLSEILTFTTKLIEKSITTRNWNEMEDISNIIYKFCNTYKFSGIACLSNQLVIPFLQYTTQFVLSSLNLMKIWAKHGEEELEEEFENDCFDILLRSFVSLISDAEMLINRKRVDQLENFKDQYQVLKQCTSQIYQNYIQSRLELSEIEINKSNEELEPTSKTRAGGIGSAEDEIDEDKKKYDEQLRSVAYIGRLNPGQSLELLKNEINRVINSLKERLSDPILFESLHWLLIFAGHLIFDAENKTPSAIPNAIEDYTFEQCKLTSPSQVDGVIDLCNAVFRFHMEYENPLLNNGKVDSISPLVSQTSLWFTSGWSLVYLLPSSVFNVQISPKIIEAYGTEQPLLSITDYFINKILLNLKCWSGDLDVLKATSNLLNSFTLNKELCKYLIRSPNWSRLFFLEGISSLPPSVYGQIFKAFSRVVFSFPLSTRREYFIQLVKTLVEQMDGVLGRPDFTKISQEAKIKENIYILLEKLNGIVSVSESEYVDDEDDCLFLTLDLFTKYATSLIAMIPLYDHCNDIVLLILRLFSNFTKNQLEYLNQDRARSIFPLTIQLFNSVATTSSHKKTLDSKEYYHRVRMMVKILTNIITFGDQRNNCPTIISETIFHAINIITPCLSNNDLLLYPKLARNYFMITSFLFGADNIQVKNIPVINTIYSLIEAGILHHDLEIVKSSFECIGCLTKSLENSKEKSGGLVDPHYQSVLIQFIGSVINFLLLQDFNVDELLSVASETLFSLMCSSPDGYRSKVIELITRQDPSIQSRVVQQFETLTIIGTDRKSKDLFMKNLQNFLVNVKSLINKK
ncbi:hypothetical protein ACTFIZ_002836 [Dictyostelium cf. discoideum]